MALHMNNEFLKYLMTQNALVFKETFSPFLRHQHRARCNKKKKYQDF